MKFLASALVALTLGATTLAASANNVDNEAALQDMIPAQLNERKLAESVQLVDGVAPNGGRELDSFEFDVDEDDDEYDGDDDEYEYDEDDEDDDEEEDDYRRGLVELEGAEGPDEDNAVSYLRSNRALGKKSYKKKRSYKKKSYKKKSYKKRSYKKKSYKKKSYKKRSYKKKSYKKKHY